MGRLGKLKRQAIQEANERNLGIIEENHAGFSLGFANNGGLTIQEEEITETTEAEEVEEEGTGEEVNDVVEEQEDFGDGAEGEGESPLEQVTEGSFAKYNITLKD